MFMLSLFPAQEFNNSAAGLRRLRTESFLSRDFIPFQTPVCTRPLAADHVFPRKKWFSY